MLQPTSYAEHEDPMRRVVDVEAVGVRRERGPGEPQRDEHPHVLEEPLRRRIGGEKGRQL
jgi:hypothetical protein